MAFQFNLGPAKNAVVLTISEEVSVSFLSSGALAIVFRWYLGCSLFLLLPLFTSYLRHDQAHIFRLALYDACSVKYKRSGSGSWGTCYKKK